MQCRIAVNTLYGLKLTDDLEITIDLYPPDNRKRDIDNHIKAVFDAMTHSKVWIDDSQIKDLRVRMRDIEKGGKAVIEIRRLQSHL
jgi:crossover junction endodeoxyribonuclease RusA